jgi:hypothetical protein
VLVVPYRVLVPNEPSDAIPKGAPYWNWGADKDGSSTRPARASPSAVRKRPNQARS